ncbi:MAG: ShlB/FhaC/HecB family hemolysin secretion/activation protein [Pseudomonadota bacterium]
MRPKANTANPRLGVAIAIALSVALPSGGADAQAINQFLRDREAEIDSARPADRTAPIDIPRTTVVAPAGAEDVALLLQSVRLVGRDGTALVDDGRLPIGALTAISQARLGQDQTLADVYEIAREVELSLKRDGFVFTRVVVPRQEIDPAGADIDILVLGVVVEAVVIEEPRDPIGPVKELIEDLVAPLQGLSNPRIEDLERASLLVTDLPGITRATFVPTAGSTPDQVILSMNVERDLLQGVGLISHRDSPVVGPGVFGGVGNLNSYTSFGASTEISYFNSWSFEDFPDLDERNTLQLTQRGYLSTGTELRATGLYSRSAPGDFLEPLDAEGNQWGFELAAEHPLLRSREFSFWINGGFDWFDSDLEVPGTGGPLIDDHIRTVFLGARGSYTDPYGATLANVELRQGINAFGASDSGDLATSRAGAPADFFVFKGELLRDQPIYNQFGMRVRMGWQWSPDPLLSNEAFVLGGARFLRGYDPSEVLGDSGFAVDAELRYSDSFLAVGRQFDYQFYGFGDYGIAFLSDTAGSQSNDLVSAGAGARFLIPNGPQLELELAYPIDDPLLRTGDNPLRVFGSLVWFF